MLTVRLLPEDELAGVADPERCVEPAVPRRTEGTITVRALRLTPADLVRLRIETDLALADMRTEVMRAGAAWRQRLAQWHADGRAAVEANELDTALLSRVLQGLRASL
ncbi:hypothetical protein FB563_2435 [Streptomyces puniciscabiei]|uniref:Uncharacterized protein n=1 Tax=Streptomyces puniciscabiei TaxID=164348 RepID=A0A542UEI7_9ACTN|nr:hypothetical protein [Streptomyces puniciscabiei]TQK97466.1 hypothetical protein FB563_2435 [Streptomyces puniciscabiei]